MKKRLTVSVIIPAFNEEKNIGTLLKSLLKQHSNSFLFENIYVLSDGSTDNTVERALNVRDKKIKVIDFRKRKGKVKLLNNAYKANRSDILVQFDADVVPQNEFTLQNLVTPMLDDQNLMVVYGHPIPLDPPTYIGKLVRYGFYAWEEAKQMVSNNERYNSSGNLTAYSKEFLKIYKIPENKYVTEDTYSFFFAKSRGYKTSFQKNAVVHFKVANSYLEYADQMNRYMTTVPDMRKIFGNELVDKYETITLKIKLKGLFKYALSQPPHLFLGYAGLHIYPKIRERFFKQRKLWRPPSSTK